MATAGGKDRRGAGLADGLLVVRTVFRAGNQIHGLAVFINLTLHSQLPGGICLHGLAGCGKTTALQEIETLLPPGSLMIVFDSCGAGRYLDSDAYRHRPKDAFLQLANELAAKLRVPLLLTRSDGVDYTRAFHRLILRKDGAIEDDKGHLGAW